MSEYSLPTIFAKKLWTALLVPLALIGAFILAIIATTYIMLPFVVEYAIHTGSFAPVDVLTSQTETYQSTTMTWVYLGLWWGIGFPLQYAIITTYLEARNDE